MFRDKLTEAEEKGRRLLDMDAVREVLLDRNGRSRIIKADFYQVISILAAQRRFETWKGGRFSKTRFVRRRDFLTAAAFYDIQMAARGGKDTGSRPWMTLYKDSGVEKREGGDRPAARKRRRSRRGGRRRRRI